MKKFDYFVPCYYDFRKEQNETVVVLTLSFRWTSANTSVKIISRELSTPILRYKSFLESLFMACKAMYSS
jgi:hypothetical protein